MFSDAPVKGFDSLFIFPYYPTREAFEKATGLPCPAWNPNQPPKAWFDPKALESTRRNVVYENTLVYTEDGTIPAGPDGKPMFDVLVLTKEHAATVNIPDKTKGASTVPGAGRPEVPVPLRALHPDEEVYFIFGQTVAVKNKAAFADQTSQFSFRPQDRELLRAIGLKLGVPIP